MSFLPSVHGFPYPNWWPVGTPVVEVWTPFGLVPIGDASGGVCGGMVFAAADYFLSDVPRPAAQGDVIFKYFCRRLLDSWNLPFGVLKYYDWQCRTTADTVMFGVVMLNGTMSLTMQEWPRIKHILDGGGLAPLGLVKSHGPDPRQMGHHHQALAYDYSYHHDDIVIDVYDPNYPGDDTAKLIINHNIVHHTREGPSVRGVFLTEYLPQPPDPSSAR